VFGHASNSADEPCSHLEIGLRAYIDHLAIVAPDLAVGARYVEEALGVAPQQGGAHPRMGTHNLLLRLGPTMYLEIIAIDPSAPAPGRARWFSLDTLAADATPRLATWAARTTDIVAAARACGPDVGPVEAMSRNALTWRITIPADGSMPHEGAAPTLIEWQTEVHPAAAMMDKGCTLAALEIFHPDPPSIRSWLGAIGFEGDVNIRALADARAPYLVAHIDTPSGRRTLSGQSPPSENAST
jgi:Glyoxalase-like domain